MNLRQEVTNTNGKYLVALILWSLFIIVCFGIVLHMVAKPVDKNGVIVKYKKKGDN